jgi:O-6-methylguanine DNA methyltransferase
MKPTKQSLLKKIDTHPATNFQKKVWRALLDIPRGEVWSYGKLAKYIHHPKAVRAVGTAVGANPFAPLAPCHRVVRSDGTIGKYSGKGGTEGKRKLLRSEGCKI